MNSKAINLVKNLSYTLTSNLVALLISTIIILIVPKVIGVDEYGYFQLYLFYSSYVGFMHLGWNDGVYLRYGGARYEELDKVLFFSQFYLLLFSQIVIGSILIILSVGIGSSVNKSFVIQVVVFTMIIVNTRYMLVYLLQATNKFKEYAKISLLDKIAYACLITLFLIFGVREFHLLILADTIGKLLSLFYAMYCCRDIVFKKASLFYFSVSEAFQNVSVGIKLMFANISSILIIGIVRFGIERTWNIATFGKISLILNISNFMMIFINAIGIILFPVLRRTDDKKLVSIYLTIRDILVPLLLGALIVFNPFKNLVSAWLPEYKESLTFMAIVFPMFFYEGKMSLLISTYLKTLRKEKLIFKINFLTLMLSCIITFFTTQVLESIELAMLSIIILLAFRTILSEFYLSKTLNMRVLKDMILELIMISIFILTAYLLNDNTSFIVYIISYLFYIFLKRKDITSSVLHFKQLIKI